MKVYISGPMKGKPAKNEPAFIKAKCELIGLGYDVVSPVDLGIELEQKTSKRPTYDEYLRNDIKGLMDCDKILMLPGWMESKGAMIEARVAQLLGIPPMIDE